MPHYELKWEMSDKWIYKAKLKLRGRERDVKGNYIRGLANKIKEEKE